MDPSFIVDLACTFDQGNYHCCEDSNSQTPTTFGDQEEGYPVTQVIISMKGNRTNAKPKKTMDNSRRRPKLARKRLNQNRVYEQKFGNSEYGEKYFVILNLRFP